MVLMGCRREPGVYQTARAMVLSFDVEDGWNVAQAKTKESLDTMTTEARMTR